MEHYSVSWVVFLIPIAGIVGGMTLAALGIYSQIRRREFEHRERLAMIEKGIAPAASAAVRPDVPGMLPTHADVWGTSRDDRVARTRGGGFILMAIGVGVAFMISMTTHDQDAALGVGGFLVILGAAIFLSAFFHTRGSNRSGSPDAPRR